MLKTKVSFVLKLIDDFNGKAIQGVILGFFQDDIRLKPVVKREGYYVFLNVDTTKEVMIKSSHYKARIVRSEMLICENPDFVTVVRLYRNKEGNFTDCEWVEGNSKKNILVYKTSMKSTGLTYKKEQQTDDDKTIILSGYTPQNLSGKCYIIGKGVSKEIFTIIARNEDGSYQLSSPLKKTFKQEEPIYRLYFGLTDKNGDYAIPIDIPIEEQTSKVECFKEEVDLWGCSYVMVHN